jgi:hypothetical protein
VQVIRVIADATDGTGDTAFSLWVAFLPRWRGCTAEPPGASDEPHRGR